MSSKFLHLVPLRSNTGVAVASAFQSIMKDAKYSRRKHFSTLVWMDKGKEFKKNNFNTCWNIRTFLFRRVKPPPEMLRHRASLSNYSREAYKNLTYKNIDISTFSQNLSQLTMTRFTLLRPWQHQKWPIRIFSRYVRGWILRYVAFML